MSWLCHKATVYYCSLFTRGGHTIKISHLSILDTISEGTLIIDNKGTIIFANHTASEMLGYVSGELHGKSVEILVPTSFRRTHKSLRNKYLDNPVTRIMSENRRLLALKKGGDSLPVCISLKPAIIDNQQLVVVGIDDISGLESIEQHKAQAEKLEALGEMVSGIAHNFKQFGYIRELACR